VGRLRQERGEEVYSMTIATRKFLDVLRELPAEEGKEEVVVSAPFVRKEEGEKKKESLSSRRGRHVSIIDEERKGGQKGG